MTEATNIFDLPTDPVGGGNVSNNITMTASETQIPQQLSGNTPSGGSGMSLDQTTINQIVSGLQQASITGATQLPSRDIPINTTSLSNDPQVQPNYVPPIAQDHLDYIKNYEQSADIIRNYNNYTDKQNSIDNVYDEIQTPLLIAILYFLFQLPFFRKFLYSYFPVLFLNDGNLNINGFLFTSALFGMSFYVLMKVTTYFGTF